MRCELDLTMEACSSATDSSGKRSRQQQYYQRQAAAVASTTFRILCPSSKTGSVIGKGGAVIRQLREETSTVIRVEESISGCDERIIVISSPSSSSSSAQQALIRVFERIVSEDDEIGDMESDATFVICRLLMPTHLLGCLIGRGGKIVEKIREDSGAQVRVLPKNCLPACGDLEEDELIQIIGKYSAAKKALLSVSSRLQNNIPRPNTANSGDKKPSGGQGTVKPTVGHSFPPQWGYTENSGTNHRSVLEEDVVFRLLCHLDKVSSLIGKGGSVIKGLQSETGAAIKITDAAPDSDERVVMISAREISDQMHSPAQEAVMRVHCRIAEIGFEPGAAVVARLLVHSQEIGCLVGKGSNVITEMRRATGASIRIFAREQMAKGGSQNQEVVQVIGSLQSVQDSLFHITSTLRETIFSAKQHLSSGMAPPFFPPLQEMPPPMFRPRRDPASPVGLAHSMDIAVDHQTAYSHGVDHNVTPNSGQVLYPFGNERRGDGPSFDIPVSPSSSWMGQAVSGNHRGVSNPGSAVGSRNGLIVSGNQTPVMKSITVDIVVPQTLLTHVYGENGGNLCQIRQISGAEVVIHEGRPGATEGVVVVGGTLDQTHAAQSLIQAFILCGKTLRL